MFMSGTFMRTAVWSHHRVRLRGGSASDDLFFARLDKYKHEHAPSGYKAHDIAVRLVRRCP